MPERRANTWKVVAILAVAGLLGALAGIVVLGSDDGKQTRTTTAPLHGVITFGEGRATRLGTTKTAVIHRLGKPLPVTDDPACMYYAISDQPSTLWHFCFRRGKLYLSNTRSR